MFKRSMIILIILSLIFSFHTYAKDIVKDCFNIDSYYYEEVNFAVSGNVAFVCAQDSKLNIFDLTTSELIDSIELNSGEITDICTDSIGNIWLAGNNHLLKYDIQSKKIEKLGKIAEGELNSFALCTDINNNVYIGTFPSGLVVKYDSTNQVFSNFCQVGEGIKSMACLNGSLFVGTTAKVVKINISNASSQLGIVNGLAYHLSVSGVFLFISMWDTQTGSPSQLYIYNTLTEGLSKFDKKICGSVSKALNNKAYFNGDDGYICLVDTLTGDILNTGYLSNSIIYKNSTFFKDKLVTCKDGNLILLDLEKRVECNKIKIQTESQIHNLAPYQDKIILSLDTTTGFLYHPSEKNSDNIALGGKATSLYEYQDKLYIGSLGGILYTTDLKTNENTKLGALGKNQDLILSTVMGDHKLFIASAPSYGMLGGAISYYDFSSNEMRVFRNIISNQTIVSLAYRNGLVYGSTSVYGGISAVPTEVTAKIFVFDPQTETIIQTVSTSLFNAGGLQFDEVGNLYMIANEGVFKVDFEQNSVINICSFDEQKQAGYQCFNTVLKDQILYTNVNGLKLIDLTTGQLTDYSNYTNQMQSFVLLGNDIYFSDQTNTLKILPSAINMTDKDLEFARKYIKNNQYFGFTLNKLLSLSQDELAAALSSYNLTEEVISYLYTYIKYYLVEDNNQTIFLNQILQSNNVIIFNDFESEENSKDYSYSGNYSYRIYGDINQDYSFISKTLEIDYTKNYTLKYRELVNSGQINLKIEYFNSNLDYLGCDIYHNNATNDRWSDVSLKLNIGNYKYPKYIKINFEKPYETQTNAYIDTMLLLEEGTIPRIVSFDSTYIGHADEMLGTTTIKAPFLVSGAKVYVGDETYNISEYGMVFSKNQTNPEIGALECTKVKSQTNKNLLRNYAILLNGEGIMQDMFYYVRPYLIYEKDGVTKTIYGETMELNAETFNGWLSNNSFDQVIITIYPIND